MNVSFNLQNSVTRYDLKTFRSPIGRLPLLHLVTVENKCEILKAIVPLQRLLQNETDGQNRTIALFVWDERNNIKREIFDILYRNGILCKEDFFVVACAKNFFLADDATPANLDQFKVEYNLHSIDLNATGDTQIFPLYAACNGGHEQVVQMLVDEQVDILKPSRHGKTPLWISSWTGNANVTQTLLDSLLDKKTFSGTDFDSYINKCDATGSSPLWISAWLGHNDVMDVLLKHNVNINLPDAMKMPPLWAACWGGNLRGMTMLLVHKASITEQSEPHKHGYSILHFAVKEKKIAAMHVLLDLLKTLDIIDSEGNSPIHAAVIANNTDGLKQLLTKGADMMTKLNIKGLSPVHVAVMQNNIPALHAFAEYHDNLNIPDHDGNTPLEMAKSKKLKSLEDILQKHMRYVMLTSIMRLKD